MLSESSDNKIFYRGLNFIFLFGVVLVFILFIVVFFRMERKATLLDKEIEALRAEWQTTQARAPFIEPPRNNGSSSGIEKNLVLLNKFGVTYGPVPGGGLTAVQIDWKEAANIQEITILDSKGKVMVAIVGDNAPHPYIVGSVPEGFTVNEGQAFENLEQGKTYRAGLKGEAGGEAFDVAFDFNIP